jgi:FKBP-type peptidyl-prolyl cis-trans isomerase SlyD
MTVTKNSVVSFHYALSDNEGKLLDSSHGSDPFAYLHGSGMIVRGLENELEGKKAGDKFKAVVPPGEGYGEFDLQLLQRVPLGKFGGQKVEAGMQFQAGHHGVFTVKEVTTENVLLDGNHPMAGVTLNFDVEVTDVREATAEELDHGHVHGPGGHHH